MEVRMKTAAKFLTLPWLEGCELIAADVSIVVVCLAIFASYCGSWYP
jgi:hypothetical protein